MRELNEPVIAPQAQPASKKNSVTSACSAVSEDTLFLGVDSSFSSSDMLSPIKYRTDSHVADVSSPLSTPTKVPQKFAVASSRYSLPALFKSRKSLPGSERLQKAIEGIPCEEFPCKQETLETTTMSTTKQSPVIKSPTPRSGRAQPEQQSLANYVSGTHMKHAFFHFQGANRCIVTPVTQKPSSEVQSSYSTTAFRSDFSFDNSMDFDTSLSFSQIPPPPAPVADDGGQSRQPLAQILYNSSHTASKTGVKRGASSSPPEVVSMTKRTTSIMQQRKLIVLPDAAPGNNDSHSEIKRTKNEVVHDSNRRQPNDDGGANNLWPSISIKDFVCDFIDIIE
ncbi:uncharacterized protein V1518DRAFT_318721 [Limtongia smithiae]|uniref:uncharacterized protein n=1 Tax=Limtongia smithiae TaxID=1125753 RepID=UPI0034CD9721